MEKLEIKKLEKKVNLDTTTEWCFDACYSHIFQGLTSETSYAGIANCFKLVNNATGHIFF